jgi:thiopurine S-methyltransferase
LGWHLDVVNPHLEKYNDLLFGKGGKSAIFVPLCGKSLDLAYLATHSKVSHVVGIDIVRDSVEQFAREHPDLSITEVSAVDNQCASEQNCKAVGESGDEESKLANQQQLFQGKGLSFLLGDLFDFMTMSDDNKTNWINRGISSDIKISSPFDGIFDRGSMVAIEPSKRQEYISSVGSLLRPGGSILLVTIEKRKVTKEEAKTNGPPFSIDEAQVRKLYEQEWVESISLLEEVNEIKTEADRERWEARGVSEAYELVFLIRKK